MLVFSMTVITLSEHNIYSDWKIKSSEKNDSAPKAMGGIAEAYGLTTREEKVVTLLIQKKSVAAIADELFLAQGTVKAHVQHIHTKFDVQSRRGLNVPATASRGRFGSNP